MSSYDYHKQFHDILGHISTIRSACSILVEDYQDKMDTETYKIIKTIYTHSTQIVPKIQNLRKEILKK